MNEVSWWGSNYVLVGVPDEEDWARKVMAMAALMPFTVTCLIDCGFSRR